VAPRLRRSSPVRERRSPRAAAKICAAFVALSMWAAQVPPPAVSPGAGDFQKQIANYMRVRKSAVSTVGGLKTSTSPEAIHQHERDHALNIRAARPDAAQGNIFTPSIAADFRRMIRGALSAPGADRVKKSVHDGEPSPLAPVAVDAIYPADYPVQSMPPSLLKQLPPLPRELEYRVVGHTLILRDIEANLIVDYIDEALP
jgi:hypothetical protein